MTATFRGAACALGLASVLCLHGGSEATAQPKETAPAIVDTFIAAVPRRAIEEINKDLEHASYVRSQAKQRMEKAQEDLHTLDVMIKGRDKDLEALDKHLDTLDADKHATEVARLKQKMALLEKVRDLIKLRRKAREEEIDACKAAVAYAEALEEYHSLEGTLLKKRSDRADLAKKPGATADLATMDAAIKEMEDEALDRWDRALKKQGTCASEERDHVSALKKLADAQAEFHAP